MVSLRIGHFASRADFEWNGASHSHRGVVCVEVAEFMVLCDEMSRFGSVLLSPTRSEAESIDCFACAVDDHASDISIVHLNNVACRQAE